MSHTEASDDSPLLYDLLGKKGLIVREPVATAPLPADLGVPPTRAFEDGTGRTLVVWWGRNSARATLHA